MPKQAEAKRYKKTKCCSLSRLLSQVQHDTSDPARDFLKSGYGYFENDCINIEMIFGVVTLIVCHVNVIFYVPEDT